MIKQMRLEICSRAKQEHDESGRQFAHVFHRPNVVCVAPEIFELPGAYVSGILIHELGHVALACLPHSEAQADRMATIISGIEVQRRDYRKLKNLEFVRPADLGKARRFLQRFLQIS